MNVWLIGDSIRMHYEQKTESILGEKYKVFAPNGNCKFASFVHNSLRFWQQELETPDIIHFNAGLWDTAILYKEDGCFTPLDVYVDYMKKVVRELKKTGAKVIFATTTPVHDDKQYFEGPMPPAHKNDDIIKYNQAVLEAFKDEEIVINDLFSLIYSEKEKYLSDDMIHPNNEGAEVLGKAVADAIMSLGNVENPNKNIKAAQTIKTTEKTIQ